MIPRSLQVSAVVRLFLALWLAITPTFAWAGSMTLLGVGGPAAGGAAYTGPGDINGAAYAWWGLRGFSGAYSTGSNPAVDLVDQAGANSITVNILSNGHLDTASIATWVAAHSVTTIKIAKAYDQSGNARHVTQATLATMPVLTLSALGSLPVMTFAGAQELKVLTINAGGTATMSAVGKDTGSAAFGGILNCTNNNMALVVNPSNVNQWQIDVNGSAAGTAAQNSYHAAQGLFSTASAIYIDGSNNATANATFGLDGNFAVGSFGGSNFLTGTIAEVGIWASDKSANNSAMNSNQHTYWGF